jgi:hypothetical protein
MSSVDCCVRGALSAQAGRFFSYFICRRYLGEWEAVVFGAPHVESSLAAVPESGLPEKGTMATEVPVEILVRLECVLITLRLGIGS